MLEAYRKMLAEALNVQQPSIAKLERRTDMYVSTLRNHIEAMSGQLEIIAPDGVSVNQFVATAVAEKLAAMNTAAFFAERRERADFCGVRPVDAPQARRSAPAGRHDWLSCCMKNSPKRCRPGIGLKQIALVESQHRVSYRSEHTSLHFVRAL
jgi:hypothetical protein